MPSSSNLRRGLLLTAVALAALVPVRASATNDAHWSKQWAPPLVRAPAAWATTTGAGIKIGIVDTGVDLGHEDLAGGKIVADAACIGTGGDPGACTPGGGQDVDGHGTHVAGVAAATKDNGVGVAGIAPAASLVVARVFDGSSARFSDVNAGIMWAVDRGANVVNLSIGEDVPLVGELFGADSLRPGIDYAWERGAVAVLAAGNTSLLGLGGSADYGDANAVVVAATGPNDEVASYSSPTGDAKWALLAPGGDAAQGGEAGQIYSTLPSNGYGYMEGTSQAAPHVSGALALLLSRGLSNQQAVDVLLATADRTVPCGADSPNCVGRLDVAKAVGATTSTTTTLPSTPDPVRRLAGSDRIETAVEASRAAFSAGTAGAGVLSRHDEYADALAGTPLAIVKAAPLLLTPSNGLDPRVEAELQRAVPAGRTVYLLGGTGALGPAVEDRVRLLGYTTVRYAGADRYETAVRVAEEGLGSPPTVLLATGLDFPDALSGGAAAGKAGAAVLLTAGSSMPNSTAVYLNVHPPDRRYALGGPASQADRDATPIVGVDRYDTSKKVAEVFFAAPSGPATAGVASGVKFPDALGGGAHVGRLGGPVLLSTPDGLPAVVRDYLVANRSTLASGYLYGGTAALSEQVRADVEGAIS